MKYFMILLMSVGLVSLSMAQDGKMNNSGSSSDEYRYENYDSKVPESKVPAPEPQARIMKEKEKEVTTITKTRKKDGTLENIIEAPFKVAIHTVGEVGEGLGHVGEGVVHIAIAPVKAIGRLFGWGTKHKEKESVTSETTVSTEPLQEMDMKVPANR